MTSLHVVWPPLSIKNSGYAYEQHHYFFPCKSEYPRYAPGSRGLLPYGVAEEAKADFYDNPDCMM